MKKNKVMLVEDNVDTAEFLQMELEDAGYEVQIAKDGQQGAVKIRKFEPDIVILDWEMPVMNGVELCKYLRRTSNVPILMVTAKKEVKERVEGLDSGANDYLVKPFDSEELLARVRALIRASKPIEKVELQFEDIILNTQKHEVFIQSKQIELSKKEFDILHYFMVHQNQVLSKTQIYESVWGWDGEGSENSVEVYVHSLRNKLESTGYQRVLHTKRGIGYIMKKE
ncbi:MAG: response regulator transcription factor [Candidatus Sericytochromatia bacterium]